MSNISNFSKTDLRYIDVNYPKSTQMQNKIPLFTGHSSALHLADFKTKYNSSFLVIYAGNGDRAEQYGRDNEFILNNPLAANDNIKLIDAILEKDSMANILVNGIALKSGAVLQFEMLLDINMQIYHDVIVMGGEVFPIGTIFVMKHKDNDMLKIRRFVGADSNFIHVCRYGLFDEKPHYNRNHHKTDSIVGVIRAIKD